VTTFTLSVACVWQRRREEQSRLVERARQKPDRVTAVFYPGTFLGEGRGGGIPLTSRKIPIPKGSVALRLVKSSEYTRLCSQSGLKNSS